MTKGHLASEFADQGDELSMVLLPIPAVSPHLMGRVEKAIDFFKDIVCEIECTVSVQPEKRSAGMVCSYLFRLQQSHQEERFHAISICHWKVTTDPNVSC